MIGCVCHLQKKKYDEELDQFVLGNLSLKTPNL
jgi:hypothetical protein